MSADQLDRKRLAERHLPLVRALAAALAPRLPRHLDLEDLVGYGHQGLLEAAERYDPARGIAFATFAHYRIRGAMVDGLRALGGLSKSVVDRYNAVALADGYLENALERETGADPAQRARASTADTLRTLSDHAASLATIFLVSLDAEDAPQIEDPKAAEARERVESSWASPRLQAALAELPDKERRLVHDCYYGGLTIKEAGERQGLSRSWACRVHARAIQKLGRRLAAAPRPHPPAPA
jgi:RNA polymerase sigma factor for flagellar operon FliA